jgi:hypothetical protein
MIDLEITDGVAFITLNAPATRNALNNELAGQFVAACDEADRDQQVGAAVIKGAGGTFCWPGRPRPACAPSWARRGCRGRPLLRWSGALSSSRCVAGSPNSQSRLYAALPPLPVSH